MSDDAYRLAGRVRIPGDKKEEFNGYILRILDLGGIRKTEQMKLGGQILTVVRQPIPDGQGIVRFDYSIFEKKKRETSEYNLNTCELYTPDRGYNEFGVVMNMIMVMQEAYSVEHGYFMYEDEPDRVEGYALLIRSVLGIHLKFPNRSRMWDMLLFLKNTKKYQNVTAKMVWDVCAIECCDYIPEQFLAVLCIDFEKAEIPKEPFEGEKSEIKTVPQGFHEPGGLLFPGTDKETGNPLGDQE